MAMRGIQKISPEVGKFLKKGQVMGMDIKEGLNFLKDKLSPKNEEENVDLTQKGSDRRNLIEQYDPELNTYIKENVKKGMSIIQAGHNALKHSRFKQAIDKMVKDHKAPWTSILQSVFGSEQKPQANQQMQQNEQEQSPQQQTQQSISNIGPGQKALMGILQSINQKLGM